MEGKDFDNTVADKTQPNAPTNSDLTTDLAFYEARVSPRNSAPPTTIPYNRAAISAPTYRESTGLSGLSSISKPIVSNQAALESLAAAYGNHELSQKALIRSQAENCTENSQQNLASRFNCHLCSTVGNINQECQVCGHQTCARCMPSSTAGSTEIVLDSNTHLDPVTDSRHDARNQQIPPAPESTSTAPHLEVGPQTDSVAAEQAIAIGDALRQMRKDRIRLRCHLCHTVCSSECRQACWRCGHEFCRKCARDFQSRLSRRSSATKEASSAQLVPEVKRVYKLPRMRVRRKCE